MSYFNIKISTTSKACEAVHSFACAKRTEPRKAPSQAHYSTELHSNVRRSLFRQAQRANSLLEGVQLSFILRSRFQNINASHRSTLRKLANYTNQKCHTQACLPTAWPVSTQYSELIFSDRCLGLIFWLLLHQGKSNKNMQGESLLIFKHDSE